jgi:hypothetical protein
MVFNRPSSSEAHMEPDLHHTIRQQEMVVGNQCWALGLLLPIVKDDYVARFSSFFYLSRN